VLLFKTRGSPKQCAKKSGQTFSDGVKGSSISWKEEKGDGDSGRKLFSDENRAVGELAAKRLIKGREREGKGGLFFGTLGRRGNPCAV